MKRKIYYAAVICSLLFVSAIFVGSASAQEGKQDFTLHNETGVTIEELYVSPVKTDDWEEDVLGIDVLADGESTEISFSRSTNACKWDLMIKDEDGDQVEWNDLNLCEISEVTLYWKDGKAWAETK